MELNVYAKSTVEIMMDSIPENGTIRVNQEALCLSGHLKIPELFANGIAIIVINGWNS